MEALHESSNDKCSPHFYMASWHQAQLVWLALKHLGIGNRETWGWIITSPAYCDENDNDGNNNNNNGLSLSSEPHFCGCGSECKMMDTDNVAF